MVLPRSIHSRRMHHLTGTNILTASLRGLAGTASEVANLLLVCPGSQCRVTDDTPSRFPCQIIPSSTSWSVYIGVSVNFNVRAANWRSTRTCASAWIPWVVADCSVVFPLFHIFYFLIQEVLSWYFNFPLYKHKDFSALLAHRCTRATVSSHVASFNYLCWIFSTRLPPCSMKIHWEMKPVCLFPLRSHVKYRFDQSDCLQCVAGFSIHDYKLYIIPGTRMMRWNIPLALGGTAPRFANLQLGCSCSHHIISVIWWFISSYAFLYIIVRISAVFARLSRLLPHTPRVICPLICVFACSM